jgi:hypothetical protein
MLALVMTWLFGVATPVMVSVAVDRARLRRETAHLRDYCAELESRLKQCARDAGASWATVSVYEDIIDQYQKVQRIAYQLAGRLATQEQLSSLQECLARMAEAANGLKRS